jgi:hypothetical protein
LPTVDERPRAHGVPPSAAPGIAESAASVAAGLLIGTPVGAARLSSRHHPHDDGPSRHRPCDGADDRDRYRYRFGSGHHHLTLHADP